MLVKLFLYYIESSSNLGHFIGNIDLAGLVIALGSGTVVYFLTDIKDYDCLERDEQYQSSRRFSQVRQLSIYDVIQHKGNHQLTVFCFYRLGSLL